MCQELGFEGKSVTFWKALWQGAARVQAEGFHPGLDASCDALQMALFTVSLPGVLNLFLLLTLPSTLIQDKAGNKV